MVEPYTFLPTLIVVKCDRRSGLKHFLQITGYSEHEWVCHLLYVLITYRYVRAQSQLIIRYDMTNKQTEATQNKTHRISPGRDNNCTSTDFARRAFRCSAPTVWNSLPETIISVDSMSIFKCRLKTYFYRKAFD